jgi:hypothetical protein
MAESTLTTEEDPHFIGWLPMPRAFARLLAPIAVAVIVVMMIAAGIVAKGHPSPGPGEWVDDHVTTLEGIFYVVPYPMLRVPGASIGDPPETILIVGEGKHGAADRTQPFDGRPVRVFGTVLQRDGRRMLELASTEDAIRPVELPDSRITTLRRSAPIPLGRVTLHGEIVDAKCYLGAMRPGTGVTHRGCAVLCLKGGIPPLFVARNAGAGPTTYLPVSESFGPMPEDLFDLAGRPVAVDVDVERCDDVFVIRLVRERVHFD